MYPTTALLRVVFGFTAIPLFYLLTSCQHYYQVQDFQNKKAALKDTTGMAQNIDAPQYQSRYFILRAGSEAYHMRNIIVSEDRKYITCQLDTLPTYHTLHLHNGRGGNMRYKNSVIESTVLNEVHLYVPVDTTAKPFLTYTLPLDKVQKIEVVEKNKGKTTLSYVLGGIGIAAGTFTVISLIALALKSSCPFVSAYDGTEMKLQGEIYGGAIYPQLCRNDYLTLQMKPNANGKLQLQISNELKEKQFTDIAELLVITHDKNVRVAADENGGLHSIAQPMLPITATANSKNVMPLIALSNDEWSFNFDDTAAAKNNNNTLNLSFERSANTTTAKLVLRLKNSYWLDMVYGKFTQGFGKYYPAFIKKQSNTPVEKLTHWKEEQQLPLHILIHTSKGWQVAESLTTTGPLATREIVVPLNLNDITDEQLNVQLSAGFMFWEIDYAAIDFSDDAALQISKLQPVKATDETGANVLPLLAKEDASYLQQPMPGNATVIEYLYTPIANNNKTQTYILHAKGYYEHVRNFTNAADIGFLKQFKQPGALSNFSMSLYKQAMNGDVNKWAMK
ncbi:hypothetical protein FC093_08390 [Ilyomonas limi]|uniref:Uncharacterized protein n=1 Tax=Ilyomonas limi TaxID=2575867 RepID=A0A4U3L4R8_9BACT|nr:hypothetical protein [Ilyomonas limi]TKK69324.1 hypothetical protein FC093_08390 [Ilyomonas limi]